jgi:SOS response regulatory protein OraA/RecX
MGHSKESIAAALKEDGVDDARIQEFLSGGP